MATAAALPPAAPPPLTAPAASCEEQEPGQYRSQRTTPPHFRFPLSVSEYPIGYWGPFEISSRSRRTGEEGARLLWGWPRRYSAPAAPTCPSWRRGRTRRRRLRQTLAYDTGGSPAQGRRQCRAGCLTAKG